MDPSRVASRFVYGKAIALRLSGTEEGVLARTAEDQIPGGLADDKKPSDFDQGELEKGTKVEMEHVNDPALAQEIAMDHLVELPDYYSRLEKMESAARVAAKFKNKKTVKNQKGEERVVYEYGPRQIAKRDKEKAERVEKLRNSLSDLRKRYKADLGASDPEKRLTALAVALIDLTYERVGNEASAKEGHFGVTGWQVDHISFSNGKATLSYVGKSGVKQKKTVSDATVVKVLKEAVKGKDKKEQILCEGEDCRITAKEVNSYLKDFGVTAKDVRGLHANEELKRELKKVRDAGPDLPRARKDKDKILKEEFQKALEAAAKTVGHEPSTLKSQYLVPGMVDSYLHDGTIMDKLTKKKSSAARVAARYATKSRTEKEDEEAERLVRESPKKKPPRRDLERGRVKDPDVEDDPDEKADKKDRSNNYKDSASRLALRYFLSKGTNVPEWAEGKTYTHDDTGNKVEFGSLPEEQQEKLRKQHEGEGGEEDKSVEDRVKEEKAKAKEEKAKADEDRLFDALEGLSDAQQDAAMGVVGDMSAKDAEAFHAALESQSTQLARQGPTDLKKFLNDIEDAEKALSTEKDPKQLAKALAAVSYHKKITDNPAADPVSPIPEAGGKALSGKDLTKAREQAVNRANRAVEKYRQMGREDRVRHMDQLDKEIEGLDENDPRRIQLEAVRRGIGVASALEDGDNATGIGSSMARLVKAADKSGSMKKLLGVASMGGTEAAGSDDQALIRDVYSNLSSEDWADVLPEGHPGGPLAELLADPEGKGRFLTDDDRQRLKEHLTDLMVAETSFLDPMVTKEVGKDATVARHDKAAMKARSKAMKKREMPPTNKIEQIREFIGGYIRALAPGKSEGEPEHKNGDVWSEGDKWKAISPKGEHGTFSDQGEASAHASGISFDKTGVWERAELLLGPSTPTRNPQLFK